jgi:hypothetical protein
MLRKVHLHLMLSDEEGVTVQRLADDDGTTVSDYVRRLIRREGRHLIQPVMSKKQSNRPKR